MTSPARCAYDLVAINTDAYPKAWSKPLTEVSFEVRSDAITETHLLVVVSEVHLSTDTETSIPVISEEIRFDTILACILHLHRIHGVSRMLSTER